jgi:Icc-related predicted phosphoesterase
MTSLVYTSDLHGNLDLYRAAGEVAHRRRADALILGGDLCPGTPSASTLHLPQSQPEFLFRELRPLLQAWKEIQPALRIFAIPGNDDCQTILPALMELETQGLIENLPSTPKVLAGYTLVGLPFVPPTPFALKDFERWDSPRDFQVEPQPARGVLGTPNGFRAIGDLQAYFDSLRTIEEELSLLPVADPARTIAVVHCPPYATHCDILFDGRHIGSKAIRRWLENLQPLLSLHGHIHESPRMSGEFVDRIGATTVINPGCDYTQPHLVFIDLEDLSQVEHSIYGDRKV